MKVVGCNQPPWTAGFCTFVLHLITGKKAFEIKAVERTCLNFLPLIRCLRRKFKTVKEMLVK